MVTLIYWLFHLILQGLVVPQFCLTSQLVLCYMFLFRMPHEVRLMVQIHFVHARGLRSLWLELLKLIYLNHESNLISRSDFLDWPRAILGWAGEENSRRSRVSFGDFPVQGQTEELALVQTVLGSPKISYYPGYVVKGGHYNQEGFLLRGYKQYWLKEDAKSVPTDKFNAAWKRR